MSEIAAGVRRWEPVDAVAFGWYVLLLAVTLLELGNIPNAALFLLAESAGLLGCLAVPILARRLSFGKALALRAVAFCVLVPLGFEIVGRLVPYASPVSRESWLVAADKRIFGSDPTQWTGKTELWPWLTEILQWIYSSFYFLPIVLALRLAMRKRLKALEDSMLVIVLGFFLSYLGYFLVPARSPYHLFQYPFQFEGLFATPWIRATLDRLEGLKYDCFPSGHSQIAMLLAALAWVHDRSGFWWFFGPIGVLLPLSTIYLRYHYGVDVLAAVLFATATWWAARRIAPLPHRDETAGHRAA